MCIRDRYFDKQIGVLTAAPEEARALFPHQLAGVDPLEAGAWAAASRVLLNLDEFIQREKARGAITYEQFKRIQTRRSISSECASSVGMIALAQLLAGE